MFSTSEQFANNLKKSISNKEYWNYKSFNLGEYIDDINKDSYGRYTLGVMLKLAPLKDEYIRANYNSWIIITNYRLILNNTSGLTSVPLDKIIKYSDYKTPKSSILEKLEKDIDDYEMVFEDSDKNIIYLENDYCAEWISSEYVTSSISLGEINDLNTEENLSIYLTSKRVEKKYNDYKAIEFEELFSKLNSLAGDSSKSTTSINTNNSDMLLNYFDSEMWNRIKKGKFNNKIKVILDQVSEGKLSYLEEKMLEEKEKNIESKDSKLLISLNDFLNSSVYKFVEATEKFLKSEFSNSFEKEINIISKKIFKKKYNESISMFGLALAFEKSKQSMMIDSFISGLKIGALGSIIGGKNKALRTVVQAGGFGIEMKHVHNKLKAYRKIDQFIDSINLNFLLLENLNKKYNLSLNDDNGINLSDFFENNLDDKILKLPLTISKMSKYRSVGIIDGFDKSYFPSKNKNFIIRFYNFLGNIKKKKSSLLSWISIIFYATIGWFLPFYFESPLLFFTLTPIALYLIPFSKYSPLSVKF